MTTRTYRTQQTQNRNGEIWVENGTSEYGKLKWTRATERHCAKCGYEFYISKASARQGHGIYCSGECRIYGTILDKRIVRKVTKKCKVCKRMFVIPRRHQDRRTVCSPRCRTILKQRNARRIIKTTAFGAGRFKKKAIISR